VLWLAGGPPLAGHSRRGPIALVQGVLAVCSCELGHPVLGLHNLYLSFDDDDLPAAIAEFHRREAELLAS